MVSLGMKEQATEITKTMKPLGRFDWVYIIHWKDEEGNSYTEYPETHKEWNKRAADLGWNPEVLVLKPKAQ